MVREVANISHFGSRKFLNLKNKIHNAFDSHTHFWATGQVACGLNLSSLKSAEDVSQIKIKSEYLRQEWLVGFGWDQNKWPSQKFPNKKILDSYFPDRPVFFSRTDGHASWVNTAAMKELKKLGYDFDNNPKGGVIERDQNGEITGILFDQAHINALLKLPDYSESAHIHFFKTAQSVFNNAGFTHIRDMSMTKYFWQLLLGLEKKNELNLAVDAFVTAETISDLNHVLQDIEEMKKEASEQLRINGVKIFIDGSLGSKTAYLTEPYLGTNEKGLLLWDYRDIMFVIETAFRSGLQVAIHTIGNAAVETALLAAREVSAKGVLGRLHLEHVQLLSNEALKLMKPLHVTCHMQPCHWLSDSPWLKNVLSQNLISQLFQWNLLQKNKIPFFFGSDTPIETPSLFNNIKALEKSAQEGIPALNGSWVNYHSHPDLNFSPSHTIIRENQILEVWFRNRRVV